MVCSIITKKTKIQMNLKQVLCPLYRASGSNRRYEKPENLRTWESETGAVWAGLGAERV